MDNIKTVDYIPMKMLFFFLAFGALWCSAGPLESVEGYQESNKHPFSTPIATAEAANNCESLCRVFRGLEEKIIHIDVCIFACPADQSFPEVKSTGQHLAYLALRHV